MNLAAAFGIHCKGLIELSGRPAKRALNSPAWTEQELEGALKHILEERPDLSVK